MVGKQEPPSACQARTVGGDRVRRWHPPKAIGLRHGPWGFILEVRTRSDCWGRHMATHRWEAVAVPRPLQLTPLAPAAFAGFRELLDRIEKWHPIAFLLATWVCSSDGREAVGCLR